MPRRNSAAHRNGDRVYHRSPGRIGVEPICRVLPIASSAVREHQAVADDPTRASDRAKRDAVLRREVQRVWDRNVKVYGVRKVWRQMRREGFDMVR